VIDGLHGADRVDSYAFIVAVQADEVDAESRTCVAAESGEVVADVAGSGYARLEGRVAADGVP
jgi:hypothetical protein